MADAIIALTANLAMKHRQRIEFEDEVVRPDHARGARPRNGRRTQEGSRFNEPESPTPML